MALPVNRAAGDVVSASDINAIATQVNSNTLPAQTGNSGKYLTTNGTSASWGTVSGGGTAESNTTDKVFYVSKSGSDSNTGRSWATAFATMSAALTALSTFPGQVIVGAGTYPASNMVLNNSQTITGIDMFGTVLQLTSNGTVLNAATKQNAQIKNLTFQFAAGVTGSLVTLNNAFRYMFENVRFVGDGGTSGQIGVSLLANAGDSHFIRCKWEALDTGVYNDTTVNYIMGSVISGCNNGIIGGDATGAAYKAGICVSDTTFLGGVSTYIDIVGTADAYIIDRCWFDGTASIAIRVGAAGTTYGPRLFSLANCPSIQGASQSLILHASQSSRIDGVRFGDTGSHPTELTIPTPATVKFGFIGAYYSAQGNKLESLVPATWVGYRGYAQDSSARKFTLLETTEYHRTDFENGAMTHRRIVIRIANRAAGDAQQVMTFPSAFESAYAGGQFRKIYDDSGLSPTFTNTAITFPVGACASGMVILEGW